MEYYISVNHSQHPEVTRVADASDEWDADDLSHSHSFDGYKTTLNDNRYWDFILTENPNQKPLYLVYVLHSSCDSFHREDGCMCKVSLVNKYEDAVKIRTAILKHERDRDKNEWKSVPLNCRRVKLRKFIVERGKAISSGLSRLKLKH